MIAENGPTIFQANSVLSAAMTNYWNENSKSGKWQFIRVRNEHFELWWYSRKDDPKIDETAFEIPSYGQVNKVMAFK